MVSDVTVNSVRTSVPSLNPCSNGIWSLTGAEEKKEKEFQCLNPCSNGIWSLTRYIRRTQSKQISLNPCSNGIWSLTHFQLSYAAD